MVHVRGKAVKSETSVDVGAVGSGQSVQISVQMTAPQKHGTHVSVWQLATAGGEGFGDQMWVEIKVAKKKRGRQQPRQPARMALDSDTEVECTPKRRAPQRGGGKRSKKQSEAASSSAQDREKKLDRYSRL